MEIQEDPMVAYSTPFAMPLLMIFIGLVIHLQVAVA